MTNILFCHSVANDYFLNLFLISCSEPMNPTILFISVLLYFCSHIGFCLTPVLLICSYLALSLEHGKILHFRVFFFFQFAHTFLKLDLGNKFCNLPNPFGVLTPFQPKMKTILVAINFLSILIKRNPLVCFNFQT